LSSPPLCDDPSELINGKLKDIGILEGLEAFMP